MSKNALKNIILNLVTLALLSAVFGFMWFEINRSGERLISFIETKRDQEAKRGSALMVQRLIEESTLTREKIDQSFFTTEGDAIQFLSQTERIARDSGLELRTESLELKNNGQDGRFQSNLIEISFSFAGPERLVKSFINYLETLPFHSSLENLSLRRDANNRWSARVNLTITVIENQS